jgi:hypothetical protein
MEEGEVVGLLVGAHDSVEIVELHVKFLVVTAALQGRASFDESRHLLVELVCPNYHYGYLRFILLLNSSRWCSR